MQQAAKALGGALSDLRQGHSHPVHEVTSPAELMEGGAPGDPRQQNYHPQQQQHGDQGLGGTPAAVASCPASSPAAPGLAQLSEVDLTSYGLPSDPMAGPPYDQDRLTPSRFPPIPGGPGPSCPSCVAEGTEGVPLDSYGLDPLPPGTAEAMRCQERLQREQRAMQQQGGMA